MAPAAASATISRDRALLAAADEHRSGDETGFSRQRNAGTFQRQPEKTRPRDQIASAANGNRAKASPSRGLGPALKKRPYARARPCFQVMLGWRVSQCSTRRKSSRARDADSGAQFRHRRTPTAIKRPARRGFEGAPQRDLQDMTQTREDAASARDAWRERVACAVPARPCGHIPPRGSPRRRRASPQPARAPRSIRATSAPPMDIRAAAATCSLAQERNNSLESMNVSVQIERSGPSGAQSGVARWARTFWISTLG